MKIDFKSIDVAKRLKAVAHTDIVSPADHQERFYEWRKAQNDQGIEMPWDKMIGRFSIKPSTLTMLAGYSGHFKSTICAQIILSAMRQGKKVGMASLELELPQIMEQLISIAATTEGAAEGWERKFMEWTRDKLYVYDRVDAIAPEDATSMTYAFKDMGCDLVVIDALMMCGLENENYGAERDFAQVMQAIAKSESLAVILVHHARKPNGQSGEEKMPSKYDSMGSSYLVNIVNNIIMVWHDKKKSHEAESGGVFDDDKPDMVVTIAKHRGGKFEGSVGLWQHKKCRGFCSTSRRRLSPVEFHG